MSPLLAVLVLTTSSVSCALIGYADTSEVGRFEQLDPRNQAVGSSYTVVKTTGDSGAENNNVVYTENEYGPRGHTSEHRGKKFASLDADAGTAAKQLPTADKFYAAERKAKTAQPRFRDSKRKSRPNKGADKEALHRGFSSSTTSEVEETADLSQPSRHFHTSLGSDEEGYDKEKHYENDAGKQYVEAEKAVAGEKAQLEYKTEEGYDKAEEEERGQEEKKGAVSEKEAAKRGHHEQEKRYGEEHEEREGEKGISVKKKGGHKKGHKKNGSHKVHHKDEYKKDEVFYDEEHDLNEHDEEAHEHEKHAKEKGDAAKKTRLDSGYHEGRGEKREQQHKAHHYDEASGHNKEAGREHHHDEHSKYGKKGGVKEGEKHGHAEKTGFGGGGYSGHGFGF